MKIKTSICCGVIKESNEHDPYDNFLKIGMNLAIKEQLKLKETKEGRRKNFPDGRNLVI